MNANWTRWFSAVVFVGPVALSAPALAVNRHVAAGGSISSALAASSSGDSVLVQGGATYAEHLVLKDGVVLRGGYDSAFHWHSLTTTISGSGTGPAVTSGSTIGSGTVVDGFVLSGGGGSPGAGVIVVGGAPVFRNNRISDTNNAGAAGGVYVSGGSAARFERNTIENNTSLGSGGGMRVEQQSNVVLVGNIFNTNVAPHSGGGLYIVESAVACSSGVFRDCTAGEGGGGGVYVQHATGVSLFGNRFENCTAPYGGGVLVRDESNVSMRGNTFTSCSATFSGGGVGALTFSTLSITDSRFDGCSAVTGGGLWTLQCQVTVQGAEATDALPAAYFLNCTATKNGGGLAVSASLGAVEAVRFSNCHSDSMGGGLYMLNSGFLIRRNLVDGCSAMEGGGLGLHCTFPDTTRSHRACVHSNTFSACSATGPVNSGAGVTFAAFGNYDGADFAGNIVTNISQGSCLKCRTTNGTSVTSRPNLEFNTISRAPGNTALLLGSTSSNSGCVTSWQSNPSNQPDANGIGGDGVDPKLCSPIDYRLQACSPALGTSGGNDGVCPFAGKLDRGAAPDGVGCPCGLVFAIEPQTWGQLKARYR
ncbi:MAG: right-handed parallel beta-helix repeat-containing protein [bacterium]